MKSQELLELIQVPRPLVIMAATGSRNYHLDDENSDYDFKIFTYPTFDDLYYNNYYHDAKQSPTVDYSVHDIRRLPDFLAKGEIGFMEVLYSEDIITDESSDVAKFLLENKDKFTYVNLIKTFNSCWHTSVNKELLLLSSTKTTKPLVEKFGYDTKQALHAYRYADFLIRFQQTDYKDFAAALRYTEEEKQFYLDIKNGKFSLDEYKELLHNKRRDAKETQAGYMSFNSRLDLVEELDDLIYKEVKLQLDEGYQVGLEQKKKQTKS